MGWVTGIPGDGTYHIKYIVGGGRERNVEERFISLESGDTGQRVKQPRCRVDWCPCFPIDCGHDQSDEMVAQENEAARTTLTEVHSNMTTKRQRHGVSRERQVKRYRGLEDPPSNKENDINYHDESESEDEVEQPRRAIGARGSYLRRSVLEELSRPTRNTEILSEDATGVVFEVEEGESSSENELSDLEVFDIEEPSPPSETSIGSTLQYEPIPREDFDGRIGLEGVDPPPEHEIDSLRGLLERGGDFLVEEGRTIPTEFRPYIHYTSTLDLRQCYRVMKACYRRSHELHRCLISFRHRIGSIRISATHDSVALACYLMDIDDDLFVFGNEIEFMKITYDQAYKQYKRLKKQFGIPENERRKMCRLNSLCDSIYSHLGLREEKCRIDRLFVEFEKFFHVSANVLASNLTMDISDAESDSCSQDLMPLQCADSDFSFCRDLEPFCNNQKYSTGIRYNKSSWTSKVNTETEAEEKGCRRQYRATEINREKKKNIPNKSQNRGKYLEFSLNSNFGDGIAILDRCECCSDRASSCGKCESVAFLATLPPIPIGTKAAIDAYIMGLSTRFGEEACILSNATHDKRSNGSPWALQLIEFLINQAPSVDSNGVNVFVIEEIISYMQYLYRLSELSLITELIETLFQHPLVLDHSDFVLVFLRDLEVFDQQLLNDFRLPYIFGKFFLGYLTTISQCIDRWCEFHEHTCLEDFNEWKRRVNTYLYLGDARFLLSVTRLDSRRSNTSIDAFFSAIVNTLPQCDVSAPQKHRHKQHWEHIDTVITSENFNRIPNQIGWDDLRWLIIAVHSHALYILSQSSGKKRITQNWPIVQFLTAQGRSSSFRRATWIAEIWDDPISGFDSIIFSRVNSMISDCWATESRREPHTLLQRFPSNFNSPERSVPIVSHIVFECIGLKYPVLKLSGLDLDDNLRLMLRSISIAQQFSKNILGHSTQATALMKKFIAKYVLEKSWQRDDLNLRSFQGVYLMIKVSASLIDFLMKPDSEITCRDILDHILSFCSNVKRQFIFDYKLILLWTFAIDVLIPHIEIFESLLIDVIEYLYTIISLDRGMRDISVDVFILYFLCLFIKGCDKTFDLRFVQLLRRLLHLASELTPVYFEQKIGVLFTCKLLSLASEGFLRLHR